jgi:hypothetical protein
LIDFVVVVVGGGGGGGGGAALLLLVFCCCLKLRVVVSSFVTSIISVLYWSVDKTSNSLPAVYSVLCYLLVQYLPEPSIGLNSPKK